MKRFPSALCLASNTARILLSIVIVASSIDAFGFVCNDHDRVSSSSLLSGVTGGKHLTTPSSIISSSSCSPPSSFSSSRRRSTATRLHEAISPEEKRKGEAAAATTATASSSVVAEETETLSCVICFDDISQPWTSRSDCEGVFIEYSEDGSEVLPASRIGKVKQDVAYFLVEPIIEVIVFGSVLLSCLLAAIQTVDGFSYFHDTNRLLQNSIDLILAAEFLARWVSSNKETGKFVLAPQFVIDVIIVVFPLVFDLTPSASLLSRNNLVPEWVTDPSCLINLLLFRTLKLQRVLKDIDSLARFENGVKNAFGRGGLLLPRAKGGGCNTVTKTTGSSASPLPIREEWQLELARVLLSIFTLLSVASGLIYTAEHDVNPNIDNYFNALYFGLTTLTTVGFGDITPVTPGGKLVVGLSILAGVAVIPAQAAAFIEALLKRQESESLEQKKKKKSTSTYNSIISSSSSIINNDDNNNNESELVLNTKTKCPACGASFHWSSASYCYSCGEKLR